MIKKDHDEIWYWHQKIEEQRKSGMPQKEYCDEYEVDYKKFCNMRYRIEYKRETHPELYAKSVPIAKKYLKSGIPASKFAKENNIEVRILSELVTHLGYLDIIENIKNEKESPMNFIQVPSKESLPQTAPQCELVEKQNDIELIITKGVKVSISPNIDSMKIIKIIELLKDL